MTDEYSGDLPALPYCRARNILMAEGFISVRAVRFALEHGAFDSISNCGPRTRHEIAKWLASETGEAISYREKGYKGNRNYQVDVLPPSWAFDIT